MMSSGDIIAMVTAERDTRLTDCGGDVVQSVVKQ